MLAGLTPVAALHQPCLTAHALWLVVWRWLQLVLPLACMKAPGHDSANTANLVGVFLQFKLQLVGCQIAEEERGKEGY